MGAGTSLQIVRPERAWPKQARFCLSGLAHCSWRPSQHRPTRFFNPQEAMTQGYEWRVSELVDRLIALGVKPGGVLLVHCSFRSIRPVEGGPLGLIAALRTAIGREGTLVMPSWSGLDDEPFDPATTPAASDLGILAGTFWRLEDVTRSDHPFAFAAAGLLAARITSDTLPLPPHAPASPIGRIHELDGQVLLLGVGHDADTTLHLAEVMAEVPYRVPRHCTVLDRGRPIRIDYRENDHCCQNFDLADTWLRRKGLQREGPVGHAHARLIRSRDIVRIATDQLARDPLVFLHTTEAGCDECDAARQSVGRTRCDGFDSGPPRPALRGERST